MKKVGRGASGLVQGEDESHQGAYRQKHTDDEPQVIVELLGVAWWEGFHWRGHMRMRHSLTSMIYLRTCLINRLAPALTYASGWS
jgi:hypothetical protein